MVGGEVVAALLRRWSSERELPGEDSAVGS